MTTKEKRFPLSLSSVVDQRGAGGDHFGRSASTQTATKNARQGANLGIRPGSAANNEKI
jgi:hypothetical protein